LYLAREQNPRSYYEDCLRVAQNLLSVSAFPLRDVADTIDPVSLIPKYPSRERVSTWESRTGLPFAAAFVTTAEDTATVLCPLCPGYIQTTVPWITDMGTGFAQKDFTATCTSCRRTFNREVSMTSLEMVFFLIMLCWVRV
jgi:hypothetical protein